MLTERQRPLTPILLAALYLLVGACASDGVRLDLVNYVNQDILGIAELEKQALQRYASVTGANYVGEQQVHDALVSEIIPLYARFVKLLSAITPETPEVMRLHGTYVRGSERLLRGFELKRIGLERREYEVIRAANDQIELGRRETEMWQQQLRELYGRYGIHERRP